MSQTSNEQEKANKPEIASAPQSSGPSNTAIYAAVISTLAFIATALNVFYTVLRPADLKIRVGSMLSAAYDTGNNLQLQVPIVFANVGAKSTTVDRVEIKLVDEVTQDKSDFYSIQYVTIEGNVTKFGDFPTAEILTGGSKTQHHILFLTVADWGVDHRWVAGHSYYGRLIAYIGGAMQGDEVDSFHFTLNENDIARVELGPNRSRYIFTLESGIRGVFFKHFN